MLQKEMMMDGAQFSIVEHQMPATTSLPAMARTGRVYPNSLLSLMVVTLVLTIYQFVLTLLNDNSPAGGLAVMALLGFLIYVYQLMSSAPATVIVLFPLLILKLTEIGSCVAVENGALMQEIDQFGYPTGGTARLAITLMAFFGIGALLIEPAWNRSQRTFDRARIEAAIARMSLPITLACLLFYAYFIFVGLRVGFPVLSGAERLDFKYQLSDPIFTSLLGNRSLFVSAMSMLALSQKTRLRAWGLFAGMFFVSVLFGEKFTSLVVMSSIFPAASLLAYIQVHRGLPVARIAMIATLLGTFTIGTCINVYSYVYNDLNTAVTKLIERMAEQGEMWYIGDRDYRYETHLDWPTISQDLAACAGQRSQDAQEIGTEFGPFFVMKHYADKYHLRNALEKGIYFAFSYPIYLMMVAGYPGFIVVWILTAAAYGLAGRFFLLGIVEGNLLAALLGQKAMFMVYTAVITGFTFYAFGYKTVGIFLAAWLAVYWRDLLLIPYLHRIDQSQDELSGSS